MPRSRPAKISGQCNVYNNVDEVWKFTLKGVEIKDDSFKVDSNHCRIVSMNAKNNPIEPAPEEVVRNNRRGRGNRP